VSEGEFFEADGTHYSSVPAYVYTISSIHAALTEVFRFSTEHSLLVNVGVE